MSYGPQHSYNSSNTITVVYNPPRNPDFRNSSAGAWSSHGQCAPKLGNLIRRLWWHEDVMPGGLQRLEWEGRFESCANGRQAGCESSWSRCPGNWHGSLSFPEPQRTMRHEEGINKQLGKGKTAGLFPRTLGSWAWLHLIRLIFNFFISYTRARLSFILDSVGDYLRAQAGESSQPKSEFYSTPYQLWGLRLDLKHIWGCVSQAVKGKLHFCLPTIIFTVEPNIVCKGLRAVSRTCELSKLELLMSLHACTVVPSAVILHAPAICLSISLDPSFPQYMGPALCFQDFIKCLTWHFSSWEKRFSTYFMPYTPWQFGEAHGLLL